MNNSFNVTAEADNCVTTDTGAADDILEEDVAVPDFDGHNCELDTELDTEFDAEREAERAALRDAEAFASAAERLVEGGSAYYDGDGVLCCTACARPRETTVRFFNRGRPVRMLCDCGCAKKKHEDRLNRNRRDLNRAECFSSYRGSYSFKSPRAYEYTFENDNGELPELSAYFENYCEAFDSFRRQNKGLLLRGPVGTGKSYFAACIANRLIDLGYTVKMVNVRHAVDDIINGAYVSRNSFIESLNRYDLLILDDLAAEHHNDYAWSYVYSLIDSRCESGKPMIVTTNLSADELKNPAKVQDMRVYDRLFKCTVPVEINRPSLRRQELKNSYPRVMSILKGN